MTIQEIKEENFCALFAPDGNIQPMTLAADMASCIAVITMLHKKKVCMSYHQLSIKGFKILPIKLTVVQAGTENDAFNALKRK